MCANGYEYHKIVAIFKYGSIIASNVNASAIKEYFVH